MQNETHREVLAFPNIIPAILLHLCLFTGVHHFDESTLTVFRQILRVCVLTAWVGGGGVKSGV